VRKDAYLSAYAASVASAQRIERIESQLESEVERETELQQLVAKEYDSLTSLEETLRTKQSPFDATVKLLQEQLAEEAVLATAGAAAAQIPAEIKRGTYTNTTDWINSLVAYSKGSKPLNEVQIELVRQEIAAEPNRENIAAAEKALDRITSDKTRVTKGGAAAPKPKPGQPSREQMVAQLAQMGETGWKGGAAGQAFREGLSSTQEKALQEYLQILGRGELPPEDHPGAPIYDQAVSVGGFQNRDVRLYTPTWVALRRRVTDLERKADQASPEKRWSGRTAEQELAYRELKARGIDPDDKYFSLRGTPEYAVLKRAEEVGSVDLNRYPGGKAITEYIRQVEESGQKLSLPMLVAQARKLEKDPAAATELAALALADANRRFLEKQPKGIARTKEQIAEAKSEQDRARLQLELARQEAEQAAAAEAARLSSEEEEKKYVAYRQAQASEAKAFETRVKALSQAKGEEAERQRREERLTELGDARVLARPRIARGERRLAEQTRLRDLAVDRLRAAREADLSAVGDVLRTGTTLLRSDEAAPPSPAAPAPAPDPRIAELERDIESLKRQSLEVDEADPGYVTLMRLIDTRETQLKALKGGK
jgi:hypothetical protein